MQTSKVTNRTEQEISIFLDLTTFSNLTSRTPSGKSFLPHSLLSTRQGHVARRRASVWAIQATDPIWRGAGRPMHPTVMCDRVLDSARQGGMSRPRQHSVRAAVVVLASVLFWEADCVGALTSTSTPSPDDDGGDLIPIAQQIAGAVQKNCSTLGWPVLPGNRPTPNTKVRVFSDHSLSLSSCMLEFPKTRERVRDSSLVQDRPSGPAAQVPNGHGSTSQHVGVCFSCQ